MNHDHTTGVRTRIRLSTVEFWRRDVGGDDARQDALSGDGQPGRDRVRQARRPSAEATILSRRSVRTQLLLRRDVMYSQQ